MGSSPTEGAIPDGEIGRRTGQKTGNLKLIKGLLQQKLKKCTYNARVGGSSPPRLLRETVAQLVRAGKNPQSCIFYKQVSYNGYYSSLPSLRRRFDSYHLLHGSYRTNAGTQSELSTSGVKSKM